MSPASLLSRFIQVCFALVTVSFATNFSLTHAGALEPGLSPDVWLIPDGAGRPKYDARILTRGFKIIAEVSPPAGMRRFDVAIYLQRREADGEWRDCPPKNIPAYQPYKSNSTNACMDVVSVDIDSTGDAANAAIVEFFIPHQVIDFKDDRHPEFRFYVRFFKISGDRQINIPELETRDIAPFSMFVWGDKGLLRGVGAAVRTEQIMMMYDVKAKAFMKVDTSQKVNFQ